jgi:hypothetical protein
MHFAGTEKDQVRSVKCCVVYDSKSGAIHHVHRIATMEGGYETPDDRVEARTLEVAAELGIDKATVRTLRVEPNQLKPGASYSVDVGTHSLVETGRIDPTDLLRR